VPEPRTIKFLKEIIGEILCNFEDRQGFLRIQKALIIIIKKKTKWASARSRNFRFSKYTSRR
jgi:hypothetical protein